MCAGVRPGRDGGSWPCIEHKSKSMYNHTPTHVQYIHKHSHMTMCWNTYIWQTGLGDVQCWHEKAKTDKDQNWPSCSLQTDSCITMDRCACYTWQLVRYHHTRTKWHASICISNAHKNHKTPDICSPIFVSKVLDTTIYYTFVVRMRIKW